MSDELEPLPELDELHELPGAPLAAARPGAPPPLRVLDKAPQHLRLAALIVVCGSLLPWMPGKGEGEAAAGSAWLMTLLAKAIMGAAAWLWLQQVYHDFGPKLSGVLGQLANLQPFKKKEKPEEDAKQRRAKAKAPTTHLVHPFPTGLHLLAFLLAAVAVAVAFNDPRKGLIGSNGIPEVLMLGWAAFTWVHIANYERWGGFNPLFPLMFLGMLFAGAAAVVGALGGEASGLTKLMGLAGGAAVACGGGLAAYTIAEAMMAAKKEGDRKKAEALEARKAARKKDR
ncbi:MAG TPA: hypothetical protein VF530_23305 [Planctomycetota bacterium]